MTKLKSLEDLSKIRDEIIHQRERDLESAPIQITVDLGTPGIAAGALKTMKTIQDFIAENHITNVILRQTANIGYDSLEPIIEVKYKNKKKVTYARVTPETAKKIMSELFFNGNLIPEFQIDA